MTVPVPVPTPGPVLNLPRCPIPRLQSSPLPPGIHPLMSFDDQLVPVRMVQVEVLGEGLEAVAWALRNGHRRILLRFPEKNKQD